MGLTAVAGIAGPAVGSATTGTRSSALRGWKGTPHSTTSPPSSPAWVAAARPACATCSAPSRPTRTPSSGRPPARLSSSTAVRVRGEPSSLCTAAYLLYSDPRLGDGRGGVLFVGPHRPYLAYIADVLPSLGEEGVQTCTLRDLVPEGAAAAVETDPERARLSRPRTWCRRSSRR